MVLRTQELTGHCPCLCCQAPPESSRELFLQYASLEEKYGLSRSAMAVYEQAVRTVPLQERFPLYELYLARASDFFGVGKVREIYETAIEGQDPYKLTDEDTKKMCMRYVAAPWLAAGWLARPVALSLWHLGLSLPTGWHLEMHQSRHWRTGLTPAFWRKADTLLTLVKLQTCIVLRVCHVYGCKGLYAVLVVALNRMSFDTTSLDFCIGNAKILARVATSWQACCSKK